MKRYINLITVALLISFINICAKEMSNNPLHAIKDKWLQWADQNVEAEKEKFLKMYNVDAAQLLKDPTVVDVLKTGIGQMIEKDLSEHPSEKSSAKAMIHALAAKIFLGNYCKKIEIIHQSELEADQIITSFHHADNKVFVTANCNLIMREGTNTVKGILRHEYSHIIHGDTLHKALLQFYAWHASQNSVEKVDENNYEFQKAYETRADIYSAVNSDDHGQSLINFFKKYPDNSPHHPKHKDRIALLNKIKAELDSAL